MIKHIFLSLILLIGVSTMVSGQTDTIPVILEDDTSKEVTGTPDFVEKYKGKYTVTATNTDIDSLLIYRRGLKWFINCGACDLFDLYYADERTQGKGFSVGLGASATSVRVREGFVSPVVYGGSAYGGTIYFEGTEPRFYWRYTTSFETGRISPIKLNSSFNRADHRLSYNQFLGNLQAALRLKKSPHYLGVSFAAEGFSIKDINKRNDLVQDLVNNTINDINSGILYVGIMHMYFNEIYEIPFRTQVVLSTLKSSTQPWGDSPLVDFSHTFKIDFMLNKKQKRKWMVGYIWNVFNQHKEDKFYRTTKSNSSLKLTWVL